MSTKTEPKFLHAHIREFYNQLMRDIFSRCYDHQEHPSIYTWKDCYDKI